MAVYLFLIAVVVASEATEQGPDFDSQTGKNVIGLFPLGISP